jgi:hypothetical protein
MENAGGKKRSEKRQRTEQFRVRLTPEERAQFDAASRAAGMDLAAFIRFCVIGKKGPRTRSVRASPNLVAWAEWRSQLGYIGNNLNQLTRLANMGDMDRPAQLDRVLAQVSEMIEEARVVMRPEP